MKSECISKSHSEYDCMICWGIRKRRFPWRKWCASCQEKYAKHKSTVENRDHG